jgi:hypothetical protein
MLCLLDGHSVKYLQLLQVEDAVDAVVLVTRQVVSRDVKDNEARERLELDDLLDVTNEVVAEVELHKCLQVL